MMRENLFYKILSYIHIVFFSSLMFSATVLGSLGLFLLPSIGAVFQMGKDVIYKKINVNDSTIKTYFNYFRNSLILMKFTPIYLLLLLDIAGIFLWSGMGKHVYSVLCLTLASILLAFMLYIAGYHTFIGKRADLIEVFCIMFIKPYYSILLFAGIVCVLYFASGAILLFGAFTAAFILFLPETLIFIQILTYRKITGNITQEDAFYYLADTPFNKNGHS